MSRIEALWLAATVFLAGAAVATPPDDAELTEGFQIRPFYRLVDTGEAVTIEITYCYTTTETVVADGSADPDALAPLQAGDILASLATFETHVRCQDEEMEAAEGDEPAPLLKLANASRWSVNGVEGGNSTLGTIRATHVGRAIYTAPAEVPDPATVTVSADLAWGDTGKLVVTAQIEIGGAGYEGTIQYKDPVAGVTLGGKVRWSASEPGAQTLDGTATLDLQISSLENNCTLLTPSVAAGGELTLNFPMDGQYHFTLLTDAPLISCSGMEFNIGGTWLLCTGWPESPPSIGGDANLRGSATCDGARMEWSFHRVGR